MKFLLPIILVGLAIPSRADMVLPNAFENARRFQFLEQFLTLQNFGGNYTSSQSSSIAIFQVANNPGLGIGLFSKAGDGNWVPALFPRGPAPRQNSGLFDDPETEALSSASAITTPEPASVVALSAALGALLLLRRRKR